MSKLKQKDLPLYREKMLNKQKGRCGLCKQPLKKEDAQLDHCFPDSVEVLTEKGFMSFYDANRLEVKVAQWDSGNIEFVYPTRYIEHYYDSEDHYDGDLFRLDKKSFSIECTPEHNVVLQDKSTGEVDFMPTEDFFREGTCHRRDKVIPKAGYYSDGPGIPLSDDEIRMYVAFHADGCFTVGARFRLRKPRKIERLKALLESCNIPYTLHKTDAFQAYIGAKNIPDYFTKTFDIDPLQFSQHQLDVFVKEIEFWDGSRLNKSIQYSSTSEEDRDYVRMMCLLSGRRGAEWTKNRVGNHAPLYYFSFTEERKGDSVRDIKATRKPYKGLVRCFSVPSGALIVKHEGNVSVYGNCHNQGHNRSAVHRSCNVLLGKIENYINRYGKDMRESPAMLKGFFKNVYKYMTADYSKNLYHPTHKLPKDKKVASLKRRYLNAKRTSTKERLAREIKDLGGTIPRDRKSRRRTRK